MNICMLTRALPAQTKGGVPDHSLMLAGGLAQSGHRVQILTTRLDGVTSPVTDGNLTIHYLQNTRQGDYAGGWWKESALKTRALHAIEPFDLIHCQSSAGYGVLNPGLHLELGVPALVSQHGTYYDELVTRMKRGFSADPVRSVKNVAAMGMILWTMARQDLPYLRRATGVIATSEEQYSLIKRVYGVPEDKLFRVWNGMDLTLFTPGPARGELRRRLGVAVDAPLLLVVARCIRDKGIQNMIRAMPGIVGRFPSCRLIVVGDGPYRPRLEQLATPSGSAIVFTGEVGMEELPDYFRECDIFINSTNQQNGYDLTMVEAMACEKPVVSSNIGSTPTLISHGVDGVLFPTADIPALENEINRLLGDPERRATLGSMARQKVLAGFDLGTMVKGTIGVYERLTGGVPGSDPHHGTRKT